MGKAKDRESEPFELTGQFLGFTAVDSYKLKYLRLQAKTGVYLIKIPKEQRLEMYRNLRVGDFLECCGQKVLKEGDYHSQVNYNATQITPVDQMPMADSPPVVEVKILLCNKGDCRRSGSEAIAQVCQSMGVKVQFTGCQKRCEQAPNLVIHSPVGKGKFSRVTPAQVKQQLTEILDNCCPR